MGQQLTDYLSSHGAESFRDRLTISIGNASSAFWTKLTNGKPAETITSTVPLIGAKVDNFLAQIKAAYPDLTDSKIRSDFKKMIETMPGVERTLY
jgi:hypothetical protein